ncbi:MAG: hypothetical protein WDW38_006322 [Sanguina aurantia]
MDYLRDSVPLGGGGHGGGGIRHAFFQPSEISLGARCSWSDLIHPIMVGTKKHKDIQVYSEVMDVAQTLDAGRRSAYDPDEIEEEQRERERRNKTNQEFSSFVKRVGEVWEKDYADLNLEFDIPFRDLGFSGVPHRWAVLRIDAIPSKSLDTIKEWLTSVKIKYYESKLNLMWKPILKNIMSDPEGFVQQGGWEFLNMDASDGEGSEEESEGYAPSGSGDDAGGGGGGDASSSDDGSNEDASVVDSDEDDAESGSEEDDEDEEKGMDWDELEEEAKKDDREREYSDSDEDRSSKKRKGGGGGGGGGGQRRDVPPPKKRR